MVVARVAGEVSVELPGAWWVKDRSTNHRDERHYEYRLHRHHPESTIDGIRRRVFPVARHCCSAI